MTRNVRDWCEKCLTCNRHKAQQQNRSPMHPIYTGEPFERVATDIIGRLLKTDRGNRYILTVVDHFTKHFEAYALADQEATKLARVFLNKFVSRMESRTCCNSITALTSNQICLTSFVKCLISR